VGPKANDVDYLDAEETTEEGPSVEEQRAQIERTRAEMSETVGAIKEKVNAQTLAQQAKETVSEMTSDLVEKAKATAHSVAQEARATVHNVVQEAKENLPNLTSNVAHRAVGGAVDEAKQAVGSAVSTARHAVGDAVDTARDASSSVVEMIRRNPIPSALIGIGLGWLWASNRRTSYPARRFETREVTGYPSYYDEGRWGRGAADSGLSTLASEGVAPAGSAMGGSLGEARSRVGEVAGQVQERMSQAAEQVQERVTQAAGQVQETVGQVAGRVQETVSDVGSRARMQMQNATTCYQRTLEENPLMLGAMALCLGAAVGLMLPGTYREDRLMGPARDQLVERAQETAEDLAARAQMVAEEAMDTAKEEARNQGLAS